MMSLHKFLSSDYNDSSAIHTVTKLLISDLLKQFHDEIWGSQDSEDVSVCLLGNDTGACM
jgi:hypothetical protein